MSRSLLLLLASVGLGAALLMSPDSEPGLEGGRLVVPAGKAEPLVQVGVASALEKLQPGDQPPEAKAIDLAAARGECESAQIAVRSSRALPDLQVSAGPLTGPGALDLTLYRVATVALPRPSGADGRPGEWPDPLIPVRDGWYGEPRAAFPVDLAAGRLQAIWVEVCVPPGATPGRYQGAVRLRLAGRALADVAVVLTVWPFELPPGPPATAGLATRRATALLGQPDDPEAARALAAVLLRHRVTPYGLSYDPPLGTCTAARCDLDWTAYDREMAPILDGRLVPGVRGTFADAHIPRAAWEGPKADLVALLKAWRRHFEARGWADRLWIYTLDEARGEQLLELARRAEAANEAEVRIFATVRPAPVLAGRVDAFVPVLNYFEKESDDIFAAQQGGRGPGPWWYVSCLSHGCDEPPPDGIPPSWRKGHAGWPGYEIDRPGAAVRAMGWLGFRQGVHGELYYDSVQAWRGDPWTDPRRFAGNGDGTLLYPGKPALLGGTHPFPVESIRLKAMRDGLEDWSLLLLARQLGLGAEAERIAAEVAPSLRGFKREAAPWDSAHRRLGELVARTVTQRRAALAGAPDAAGNPGTTRR